MPSFDTGRPIPCADCPLRALPRFRAFSKGEVGFVQSFKQGELTVEPGGTIIQEETNSPHLYTVLQGWAFRYKTLEDGRRQILNFVLPGDFVGLQASVMETLSHSVEALTPMLLCVFPRDKVWTLYERQPALGFDLTWLAAREERLLDEALLSLGRRTARERVAWLLWVLDDRARSSGLADGDTIAMPLTQQHVADTLGLSLVHTNRTLKSLRAAGVIRWEKKRLAVVQRRRLLDMARAEAVRERLRPFI